MILLSILLALAILAAFSFVLMFCWNLAIVHIWALPTLDFWQAVALLTLILSVSVFIKANITINK